VTWNLGEETSNTASQREAYADYFNAIDPYFHLIGVHTWPSERSTVYTPMIGTSIIHGAAMQVESPSIVHTETLKWVGKSAAANEKWIVTLDEVGSAGTGVMPDANDPTHGDILHRALWGNLMAGGAGVEWYFGYSYPNDDLGCEDWYTRDKMWTLSKYAADFFRNYMPLPLVKNYDSITSNTSDYVLGKPGVAYAIYLPDGATTNITVPAGEGYTIKWYNPRAGGALVDGTVKSIAGGTAAVGKPPTDLSKDWVALLRRGTTTTSGSTSPTTTSPTPTTAIAVTALKLINTNTQAVLRTVATGSTISLSNDGSALNISATTSGTIGSVDFNLDGTGVRIENAAPFSIGGDSSGKFLPWKPSLGTHTLRVVPYTAANGTGSAGTGLTVTFTVVQ
jgi:hypothetical protein